MQIMSDSQFRYTANQNQFQNNYYGMKTLSVDKINLCCIIAYFSKKKYHILYGVR